MAKKFGPFLDLCVSSLRRGHANLLCIIPILSDVPEGGSLRVRLLYIITEIVSDSVDVGLKRKYNNSNMHILLKLHLKQAGDSDVSPSQWVEFYFRIQIEPKFVISYTNCNTKQIVLCSLPYWSL